MKVSRMQIKKYAQKLLLSSLIALISFSSLNGTTIIEAAAVYVTERENRATATELDKLEQQIDENQKTTESEQSTKPTETKPTPNPAETEPGKQVDESTSNEQADGEVENKPQTETNNTQKQNPTETKPEASPKLETKSLPEIEKSFVQNFKTSEITDVSKDAIEYEIINETSVKYKKADNTFDLVE
ncbi:MAG: hypothetical protein ACRCUP_03175, partial [Mycoplasmatales bacterium]